MQWGTRAFNIVVEIGDIVVSIPFLPCYFHCLLKFAVIALILVMVLKMIIAVVVLMIFPFLFFLLWLFVPSCALLNLCEEWIED